MKTLLDVHTHTIASGHAYSSLQEMTLAAKEKGFIQGFRYAVMLMREITVKL